MNIEKLEKLNELKEKGILTDEEFQTQKAIIMSNEGEKVKISSNENGSLKKLEHLEQLVQQNIVTPEEYSVCKENILKDLMKKDPKSIRSDYVWFLAFAPLYGQIIENFIMNYVNGGENVFLITIFINILLSILDSKELKKAGYEDKFLDESWLVPAYLYQRAKLLNENPSYLWLWIVCFVIILL